MKVFEIKVYEQFDVVFRLAVCKTRKEMIAAIKRHVDENYADNNYPAGDTQGMFCPTAELVKNNIPGTFNSNMFGTMFLNIEDADIDVIAHECGHAAFGYEFYIRHFSGRFDDDSFEEQEAYCYFLGGAVRKVREAVKKTGGVKI